MPNLIRPQHAFLPDAPLTKASMIQSRSLLLRVHTGRIDPFRTTGLTAPDFSNFIMRVADSIHHDQYNEQQREIVRASFYLEVSRSTSPPDSIDSAFALTEIYGWLLHDVRQSQQSLELQDAN